MLQVISTGRWKRWCRQVGLDVDAAPFATHTCYLGRGVRTRPGTLVVTDGEVIHPSYSWRETPFALFEPSVCVSIRLDAIGSAHIKRIGFLEGMVHGSPQCLIQLLTQQGERLDLFLHESCPKFLEALEAAGVEVREPGTAGPSSS